MIMLMTIAITVATNEIDMPHKKRINVESEQPMTVPIIAIDKFFIIVTLLIVAGEVLCKVLLFYYRWPSLLYCY